MRKGRGFCVRGEGGREVEGVSSVYIRVDLKVDLKKGKERTLVWFCLK